MLHENHELVPLIINSIRQDLLGRADIVKATNDPNAQKLVATNELFQCLALTCIANIGMFLCISL